MDKYIERAINEHMDLTNRIIKLNEFINDNVDNDNIDKVEFALMSNQLSYMINYRNALESRLDLHNVVVEYNEDSTEYFEKIGRNKIVRDVTPKDQD